MKSITKKEEQEFKDRWKFVNDFIARQIRNTPAETKLQQLSVMLSSGRAVPPFLVRREVSPESLAIVEAESQCSGDQTLNVV